MTKTEPLQGVELDRKTFFCMSCFIHKPISALSEGESKHDLCVTCLAKIEENKRLSDSAKMQARYAKFMGMLNAYRRGETSNKPRQAP